jgi:hypothetical protein
MDMGPDGMAETLAFILAITAITVFPFLVIMLGVMIIRWRMTKNAPPGQSEPGFMDDSE